MIEPEELHAEFDRVASRDEPPLTLDSDRVVAAGRRKLRRRQALRVAGVAAVTAAAVAVPTLVLTSPGGGVQAASRGGSGPSIEPTPGAPHGGCQGRTRSSSTDAYHAAQWLQTQLPGRHHYETMRAWQVSYENDCVDGAKQDSTTVDFRVVGRSGEIDVELARNNPTERAPKACQVDDNAATAAPSGAPSITTSGTPATTRPGSGPANGTGVGKAPVSGHVGADGFTRCETEPQQDGSKLVIDERHLPGSPAGVTVERRVTLWHPDGTQVTFIADNRVVDAAPASDAPLTISEMIALATNRGIDLYYPPAR